MSRFMANEPESTFFIDVFKIALGVFIGGLLAALAYTKIIALGVEQAAAEATASMQREMQKMKAQEEQEPGHQGRTVPDAQLWVPDWRLGTFAAWLGRCSAAWLFAQCCRGRCLRCR